MAAAVEVYRAMQARGVQQKTGRTVCTARDISLWRQRVEAVKHQLSADLLAEVMKLVPRYCTHCKKRHADIESALCSNYQCQGEMVPEVKFCQYCLSFLLREKFEGTGEEWAEWSTCRTCEDSVSDLEEIVSDSESRPPLIAHAIARVAGWTKPVAQSNDRTPIAEEQIAYLEKYGITPTPTKKSANSLIRFIETGEGSIGGSSESRAAFIREQQARLLGRRVRLRARDGEFTVGYILARPRSIGMDRRKSPSAMNPMPLSAVLLDEGGKSIGKHSINSLTIL